MVKELGTVKMWRTVRRMELGSVLCLEKVNLLGMGMETVLEKKVKGMEMVTIADVRKGLVKQTAEKLRVRKMVVMVEVVEMMVEAVSELKEMVIRLFEQARAQRTGRQTVHCCHW